MSNCQDDVAINMLSSLTEIKIHCFISNGDCDRWMRICRKYEDPLASMCENSEDTMILLVKNRLKRHTLDAQIPFRKVSDQVLSEIEKLTNMIADWKEIVKQKENQLEPLRKAVEKIKSERLSKLNLLKAELVQVQKSRSAKLHESEIRIDKVKSDLQLTSDAFNLDLSRQEEKIASELEELKGELEWLKINPHPDIKRKLQAELKKLQQKSEREIYRLREELQSREINLRMLEDREMDAKGNKTPKKKGKQLESGRKTPTGKGKSPTSMLQSVGPIPAKRMRQSLLTKKKKL